MLEQYSVSMTKWIVSSVVTFILAAVFMYFRANPAILRQASEPRSPAIPAISPTSAQYPIVVEQPIYYRSVKGYYVRPAREGTYPGIIMVHGALGLNDTMQSMARLLADEGYAVLAVDLFNGQVAENAQEAETYMKAADQADSIENMEAAYQYLRGRNSQKVASFGWGFGGGQSLALAARGVPLSATVLYSGTPLISDKERLSYIKGPLLGIFGNLDTSVSQEDISTFQSALVKFDIEHEVIIYPDVRQDFANPTSENYDEKVSQDAWNRTLTFLGKHLK